MAGGVEFQAFLLTFNVVLITLWHVILVLLRLKKNTRILTYFYNEHERTENYALYSWDQLCSDAAVGVRVGKGNGYNMARAAHA